MWHLILHHAMQIANAIFISLIKSHVDSEGKGGKKKAKQSTMMGFCSNYN